jgi:GNAT superfamily N-acetyltransferase
MLVRRLRESDLHRVPQITTLIHAAYAPLAARGLRYLATHQDDATTLERLNEGVGLVALEDDGIVATITYYPRSSTHGCAWYDRADVAKFGQLAVHPACQGRGITRVLLGEVERLALEDGAMELACDTSEHASELRVMYGRRGYREVGFVRWDVTNYRSVILSKTLSRES